MRIQMTNNSCANLFRSFRGSWYLVKLLPRSNLSSEGLLECEQSQFNFPYICLYLKARRKICRQIYSLLIEKLRLSFCIERYQFWSVKSSFSYLRAAWPVIGFTYKHFSSPCFAQFLNWRPIYVKGLIELVLVLKY